MDKKTQCHYGNLLTVFFCWMKKKVIFVGSFRKATKDGSTGGQMFACKSLINSPLNEDIDFITIDTTAVSVPPPHVIVRLFKAIKRIIIFIFKLLTHKINAILIFSADGFSFIEKGLMALIGKIFQKKVIFAPRSGLSKDDYQKSRFMRMYMKFILNQVDYIICQGNRWKEFYQKVTTDYSSTSKFVIQQNWLNIDEYVQNQKEYSINDSSLIKVMYLGWIEEYKGIYDILKAVKETSDKGIEIELKIYGSGSKLKEAKELAKDLHLNDNVHFEGWANQTVKLNALAETDIFVLPSHKEGFPNSLLEAMASQLPVIATNVGGVADLIKNEYNGILIEQNNVQALSDAMIQLATDGNVRRFLATNARKAVIENNSVQKACQTFASLFMIRSQNIN
ncbi:MAG: glycosyltransferase family 4 protein [Ginsengibacter sp.]